MDVVIVVLLAILCILTVILLIRTQSRDDKSQLQSITETLKQFEFTLRALEQKIPDEFQRNRQEFNIIAQVNREEQNAALEKFSKQFSENIQNLNDLLRQKFGDFSDRQKEIIEQYLKTIKELKESIENQLKYIREDNTRQLDEMRKTVDEKLQKTLNDRLSQSFETVGKQLQAVQEGLGEMKNLANDVGGLKKVLSNVKQRGGIGEFQLGMLLEQILAPAQYDKNVKTNPSSNDLVEYAIKLPGREKPDTPVWLPIDAKFPKDVYETLIDAYEDGDPQRISDAQKTLETTIKKMAKDISEKYLAPPYTTDFGIMFLPFEGIYAEVVRKAALLEELQNNYKIIVTGPTTLAAILNSLQMGFRTLAIQKRSSEVWEILRAVKTEFEKFGGMLQKAQNNIQTGLNQLDDVIGVRTRAIHRTLKNVEKMSETEAKTIFPEIESKIDDYEDA